MAVSAFASEFQKARKDEAGSCRAVSACAPAPVLQPESIRPEGQSLTRREGEGGRRQGGQLEAAKGTLGNEPPAQRLP